MSVLIAQVPKPSPVHETPVATALRQQIRRGASDAVLIRIAGSRSEYLRLAVEFKLRPLALYALPDSPPVKPAPRQAIAPRVRGAAVDISESRSPAADTSDSVASNPVEGTEPVEPTGNEGSVGERDTPPIVEAAQSKPGGASRPKRRRVKQSDGVDGLLRELARLKRDLAAYERRQR